MVEVSQNAEGGTPVSDGGVDTVRTSEADCGLRFGRRVW